MVATEAGYLVDPTPSSTKKTYSGLYRFGATTNPGPFSKVTGGVRYHGPIPHRGRDTVAAGIVYSLISGVLNRALSQEGLLPFGTEKALEVNYSLQVTRWFTCQPVFQY